MLSSGDFGFISWGNQEKQNIIQILELHDTNERSMPGWAMNLDQQLLEERERKAKPPGELRTGFVITSRWTNKELSLSPSTSSLRPS